MSNTQQLEQHRTKAFFPGVSFKTEGAADGAGGTLGPGEFTALAAVFNNIDSYGDRMMPGAFTETLSEWSASGDPIPVIWQHNWADPNAHIGYVLEAKETTDGLWYKGKLDIADNPFAMQVYKLMKGRRVTQQSFGFDVLDGASVTVDGVEVFDITRVHLYEVGPCLVGVNQDTNLLEIKAAAPAPAAPSSSAAAPAATEPSGQAAPSASESASVPSGSAPDPSPASKGISPASTLLILDSLELEGED